MSYKRLILVALLIAGCNSVQLSGPKVRPPVTAQTDWRPLQPEIHSLYPSPLKQAVFSAEEQQRIGEAVGGGIYRGSFHPTQESMPDRSTWQGIVNVDQVSAMMKKVKQQPFTVIYRLEGDINLGKPGLQLLGAVGSGRITVRPNGDFFVATDRLTLVRHGDGYWRQHGSVWTGPYDVRNIANDVPATAVANLTADQLGLLDVAYRSAMGVYQVMPDGTEAWYQRQELTLFGSDWLKFSYYKLTVKKEADGYRPIALDVRFESPADAGLHAEWNFDTPDSIPALGKQ